MKAPRKTAQILDKALVGQILSDTSVSPDRALIRLEIAQLEKLAQKVLGCAKRAHREKRFQQWSKFQHNLKWIKRNILKLEEQYKKESNIDWDFLGMQLDEERAAA